jgi:hypothetical protein
VRPDLAHFWPFRSLRGLWLGLLFGGLCTNPRNGSTWRGSTTAIIRSWDLAHQDLFGAEGGVPEWYLVELDEHATVPRAGQLRRGAGQPARARELVQPLDWATAGNRRHLAQPEPARARELVVISSFHGNTCPASTASARCEYVIWKKQIWSVARLMDPGLRHLLRVSHLCAAARPTCYPARWFHNDLQTFVCRERLCSWCGWVTSGGIATGASRTGRRPRIQAPQP